MKYVDLSQVLEDGMKTSPGLPPARITAFLDRKESRSRYGGKAEFYLGKVDMPCNVGTYLDSPFHRYPDRPDLSQIPLERVAGLQGIVLDGEILPDRSVRVDCVEKDLRERAVLVKTGWDQRWGTDSYWEDGPYLTDEFVDRLIRSDAALVGVDFGNVDNTKDLSRPVHTRLLAANILIIENLCGLNLLSREGFKLYAVPPRIVRGASFPVRAFVEVRE